MILKNMTYNDGVGGGTEYAELGCDGVIILDLSMTQYNYECLL